MKTFVLDVLAPEDEDMVLTILEGLRKGNAIRFHALGTDEPTGELQLRIQDSLNSPRLTWEEGLSQLGL
ncbi:hypothetical protein [Hymenobacter actinosclerus]|uniref:Uncharacterized protein n=1 Tax=Hymenobacter actinosclerus TaxID=82805 RepID=A0A1I0I5S2_9BACT|nr:hypothetical protein [Hymenobacter actinosclerus]SET91193.1 hypothetical protein SAMN04487998_3121 [Hymenobacter actinosclerus]